MAKKPRIPKLETAQEIRQVVRVTVRELKQGKIDAKTANAIIYALKLAKELIEVGELEERVRRLEELVQNHWRVGNGSPSKA